MKYDDAIIALAFALGSIACGGDTTDGTSSGTNTTGSGTGTSQGTSTAQGGAAQGGGAQGGAAQGGAGQGGAAQGGAAQGGTGQGGAGPTGCANDPSICPPNWECCTGVPYPPEGQCYPMCQFQSDRMSKHDVMPVDPDLVLERLAAVPVARWRYDADPSDQHMGPMAQDFHAAFGLGDNDKSIAAVDANGVTMAAIQALHRRVEALRARDERLERQNAGLRAEVARLRAELVR